MGFKGRFFRRAGLVVALVGVVAAAGPGVALAVTTDWGATYQWTVHSTDMYTKTAIVIDGSAYRGRARMGTISGFRGGRVLLDS
jgi:hypothetical protein